MNCTENSVFVLQNFKLVQLFQVHNLKTHDHFTNLYFKSTVSVACVNWISQIRSFNDS